MCTENYMHSVSDHSKLIIANKYKCKEKVNREASDILGLVSDPSLSSHQNYDPEMF